MFLWICQRLEIHPHFWWVIAAIADYWSIAAIINQSSN